MISGLRNTVRGIIASYQTLGIEAQTDQIAGFITELLKSRDELEKKYREEAEQRWKERMEFVERVTRESHIPIAQPLNRKEEVKT